MSEENDFNKFLLKVYPQLHYLIEKHGYGTKKSFNQIIFEHLEAKEIYKLEDPPCMLSKEYDKWEDENIEFNKIHNKRYNKSFRTYKLFT